MLIETPKQQKSIFLCNHSRISSVGRVLDYRVGGHRLNSQDWTSTHGLK